MTNYEKIINKYPDRVPVILEKTGTIELDKNKFLIQKEQIFGKFVNYIINHHIKSERNSKKSYYFFTKTNTLVPTSILMSRLYEEQSDSDQCLRLTIREENTFG